MARRQPINWEQIAKLEVDENGRLYWNGKAVILEKRLRLEAYQIWLASLATIGTVLAGVHPFLISFGVL